MKKKLIIIFIIVTTSLIGIIYFQATWTYKTYQINLAKLDENVRIAFGHAQKKVLEDYLHSVKRTLTQQLASEKYTVKVDARIDSLNIVFTRKDSLKGSATYLDRNGQVRMPVIQFAADPIRKINIKIQGTGYGAETSAEHNFLMQKTVAVLLGKRLTSIDSSSIEAEIKNMPLIIHSKQELLSDSIKFAAYFKKEMADSFNVQVPFHIMQTQEEVDVYFKKHSEMDNTMSHGLGAWHSHNLIWYGIGENHYNIGIDVYNPSSAVLHQMLWLLLVSAFLILSTIFCYIYLFRIILRQKRLAEMKDDFINNMTHELKTPIATVSAAVESLQKPNVIEDKERTSRYLETSRKELNRLNDLVTKVLNMAGYEKKKIELLIQEIPVDDLINEIINNEKLNSPKTIPFTFSNSDNIQTVKADGTHFRNALANLVDNAVKYSDDPVEIDISCYTDDQFIYFSVRDNGIGIPATHINRIFDKFHRVSTGNIHNVKGTGLGLSYVKYVIETHGGTISVKSIPGKGSEFIVSLPLI